MTRRLRDSTTGQSRPLPGCDVLTNTPERPQIVSVGSDAPLRLGDAVKLAFPCGGMTVSGLRREAARGRLEIETIAGKQFVTMKAIEQMRAKCRDTPKVPDCGLKQKRETRPERSQGMHRGSSETERIKAARAALEMTARGLSKPSPNTSPKNTKSRESAAVIRLKS